MLRPPAYCALGAALSLWSCSATEAFLVPEVGEARSVLFFAQLGGQWVATPKHLETLPTLTWVRAEQAEFYLAFLSQPLEGLELEADLPIVDAPGGLPLPEPLSTFRLSDADSDWLSLAQTPAPLRSFRVAFLPVSQCLALGRCYGPAPEDLACVPCPEVPPPLDPEPPARPRWTPCPDGWSLVEDSTSTPSRCEVAPALCGPETLALPSAPSCGAWSACPSGDYPSPLPSGPSYRYVGPDPGGVPRDRVHDSLAAALQAASPGDHLLLARGAFALGPLRVPNLTVEGACAAGTVLTGSGPVQGPGLQLSRIGAADRLVFGGSASATISEALLSGLRLEAGTELSLRQSRVETSSITVIQGTLRMVGVDWRGAGPRTSVAGALWAEDVIFRGQAGAPGLVLRGTGAHRVSASVVLGYSVGIELNRGSAELEAVLIRGAETGIWLRSGTMSGTRLDLADGSGVGILAEAGTLTLEDLLVRGVQGPDELRAGGLVVGAQEDCTMASASFTGKRLYLADNGPRSVALRCGAVQLEDLQVEESAGPGVLLYGAQVRGDRWAVGRSQGLGVAADGDQRSSSIRYPLRLELRDLRIEQSQGEGLAIGEDTEVDVERVVLYRSRPHGLAVRGRRASARLSDVLIDTVTRVASESACVHAAGNLDDEPLTLSLRRFRIEEGAFAADLRANSDVHFSEGWIRDCETVFRLGGSDLELRNLLRTVHVFDNGDLGLQ